MSVILSVIGVLRRVPPKLGVATVVALLAWYAIDRHLDNDETAVVIARQKAYDQARRSVFDSAARGLDRLVNVEVTAMMQAFYDTAKAHTDTVFLRAKESSATARGSIAQIPQQVPSEILQQYPIIQATAAKCTAALSDCDRAKAAAAEERAHADRVIARGDSTVRVLSIDVTRIRGENRQLAMRPTMLQCHARTGAGMVFGAIVGAVVEHNR